MFLYPAVCELILPAFSFVILNINWIDEFRVAYMAIRPVGLDLTSFCGQ